MGESKRAVLIGINKYLDHPAISELQGAENDAVEVYARLVHEESGGFQIDRRGLYI